jgi:Ribonuclease HepT-like
MREAAHDAVRFVEGLSKDAFAKDRRTKSAVVMSLRVIGEGATRVVDRFPEFAARYPAIPRFNMVQGASIARAGTGSEPYSPRARVKTSWDRGLSGRGPVRSLSQALMNGHPPSFNGRHASDGGIIATFLQ